MKCHVDTPYGDMPGCPVCGVIAWAEAHVCEHGVTPPPTLDVSFSFKIEDRELFDRLMWGGKLP